MCGTTPPWEMITASDELVSRMSGTVLTHHLQGVCSILRRFGLQVEGGVVQYWHDRDDSATAPTM